MPLKSLILLLDCHAARLFVIGRAFLEFLLDNIVSKDLCCSRVQKLISLKSSGCFATNYSIPFYEETWECNPNFEVKLQIELSFYTL